MRRPADFHAAGIIKDLTLQSFCVCDGMDLDDTTQQQCVYVTHVGSYDIHAHLMHLAAAAAVVDLQTAWA